MKKFSPSLAPRGLAIALGVLALAAPAALAQGQDLRAPDNQVPNVRVVDLRSPDARDAAAPTPPPRGAVFRWGAPHSAARVAQSSDDGFDWGSGGIVAVAIAGFILLALGGYAVAYRARVRPAR
jgi:hypothetical protein